MLVATVLPTEPQSLTYLRISLNFRIPYLSHLHHTHSLEKEPVFGLREFGVYNVKLFVGKDPTWQFDYCLYHEKSLIT